MRREGRVPARGEGGIEGPLRGPVLPRRADRCPKTITSPRPSTTSTTCRTSAHAYTTIAADALARYHRLRGHDDACFLTGTDEHGQKIERIAEEHGLSPSAFVDKMSTPFRDAWPAPGSPLRRLHSHHRARHETRAAQSCGSEVRDSGDHLPGRRTRAGTASLARRTTRRRSCSRRATFARSTRPPVERISEPTYFFRLSNKYEQRLLACYERHPAFVQPATRMNEVTSFVRGGLEDLSVSRTTFTWGVPVPGDPGHVMYVWFDALGNYWSALQEPRANGSASGRRTCTWWARTSALPRRVLAGVPDGRGFQRRRASAAGVRARVSHVQRAEDVQVPAQHGEPARARRCVRRRHAALLSDARDRVRARWRLQRQGLDRALQAISATRSATC